MLQISEFLKKFQGFTPKETTVKKAVVQAVQKHFNLGISEDMVQLSNHTVFLAIPPVAKSEVLLHKKEFLQTTNSIIGKIFVEDIK